MNQASMRRAMATAPPEAAVLVELSPDPTASRVARSHVRRTLSAWHVPQADIDSVELVVSELVTNALRHACQPGGASGHHDQGSTDLVTLTLRPEGAVVVVEVHDRNPLLPHLADGSVWDEAGRGLQLVAALSQGWESILDTRAGRVVGKTVRARVPAPFATRTEDIR